MICNDFDVFLSIIGHFFSERVESSDPIARKRAETISQTDPLAASQFNQSDRKSVV